jgi:hypothetical protein
MKKNYSPSFPQEEKKKAGFPPPVMSPKKGTSSGFSRPLKCFAIRISLVLGNASRTASVFAHRETFSNDMKNQQQTFSDYEASKLKVTQGSQASLLLNAMVVRPQASGLWRVKS